MDEFLAWLEDHQSRLLPKSKLMGAINYMLSRWKSFTRFLESGMVPMDNNVAERSLKMSIRHRKNSLFYKTLRGAQVGDLYMSLMHTCCLSKVDPFDYLTELQGNHERVVSSPVDWTPWNYRRQLARTRSPAPV